MEWFYHPFIYIYAIHIMFILTCVLDSDQVNHPKEDHPAQWKQPQSHLSHSLLVSPPTDSTCWKKCWHAVICAYVPIIFVIVQLKISPSKPFFFFLCSVFYSLQTLAASLQYLEVSLLFRQRAGQQTAPVKGVLIAADIQQFSPKPSGARQVLHTVFTRNLLQMMHNSE